MNEPIVKCPDCLVLMIHQDDDTWICPYALAAKASRARQERKDGDECAASDHGRTATTRA